MNILLTGASGFIGSCLHRALTQTGHSVTPVSRRHGVDFSHMLRASDWVPHLRGIDTVINAVGIIGESKHQRFDALHHQAPSALFQACAQAGVRRVVQISALGSDDTAFSAYHLSKLAADNALRQLDLDWMVLRPSLIYGRGGKSAALFMRLATLPRLPAIGDGQQTVQPVHISDVVATVMQSVSTPHVRQTLDVLGPQTYTWVQWLQTLRTAQGLAPAPVCSVPYPLALQMMRLARYVSPMLHPDNLRMLQTGYHASPQALTEFLGRPPLAAQAQLFFTDSAPNGSPA